MAQLITVRLAREGGCPWGFRLQGGKDFGTPLVIQKVNGGSPAERAGLVAGDSVIRVNTTDVFNLRHKDAQDVIVRAGQSFEMTVQRGGSTWKPAVTPVGSVPRAQPVANNISPVTKTSLAAQHQDYTPIGTSHNVSAKGFTPAPHMNGDGPKLVNKQYNTPIGLYSEQSIAETLSAQAEVLSTGAMGVNFKKNEKNYDAEKSEVYKMLQEAEREPRTPEPAMETDSGVVCAPAAAGVAGLRHVAAPIDRPAPPANTNPLPPGQNICADCERLIVGVFVRIKDKNLHVECFKCATCGTSLKNVGYYNINNKLYCDIHAKLAARNNPPAPNLVPITIPPGGKVPASAISSALASHALSSPSPMSPSGNQVAAPFSPPLKYDNTDRYSPNNNHNLQKMDAVANLMSTLTMASQKEFKENGTNSEQLYFTEKTFPVNNNVNYNNEIKEEQFTSPPPAVKYMPYRPKSASSFSGPRPFSSVAPSTPTAPVPFSSVQPSTPSTPMAAPFSAPMSNTLPRSGSSATIPERKEWPPSKPEEIPTACPLYINPASRNPTPQPKNQNPEPNMPYIPMVQNSNPLPQITISQNSPPSVYKTQSKQSKSQVEELNSDYRSTQSFDRNMSICSTEVTNLTGGRSVMECVETVSDAVDTQILVDQVTKIKERPKSPPPVQRKDSVYDTQDISIVVSTKTPGGKNPTENSVITVDDKSPGNIKENPRTFGNPGNPKICPNIATCNQMIDPDSTIKISCPKNNPTCLMNPQYNVQSSSSTNIQQASNISQTTSTTTIKNPVPKEYISPMVKALTIASDRSFNTVSVEIKSKEYGTDKRTQDIVHTEILSTKSTSSKQASQQMKSVQETMAIQQEVKSMQNVRSSQNIRTVQEVKENRFPHMRAPVAVSPMASALTIAPSKPFAPTPQITLESVSLPAESKPYIPPEIPITVEPKVQKQVTACKSPFVDALTTAPERPYTPLMGKEEQSSVPDFMKDVPPPSKHKMSMLSALTTASERPFTPTLSPGNIEDLLKPNPEPAKPKFIPTPPPMPNTIKPASHTSPSAFRPIGNCSFKPIAQQSIPKIQTSSYYGHSVEQSTKYAPQQSMRSQQFVKQEEQNIQTVKSVSTGLHSAASIPGYQINLSRKYSYPNEVFVPEIQAPIQPKQKPVTTLQPGQYQPNNHLQTFQPVVDDNHVHYLKTSSPLPRAISPSLINKPPPTIPYYQADLVAHECEAVEINLFDPRSPAISRSPSPCPGARSTSPFPRTMSKSPAQGPPPNPRQDRMDAKKLPVRDARYLEAKENLTSYLPKYQGRVDQISIGNQVFQYTGQSQMSSGQSQVGYRQSQALGQSQMSSGQSSRSQGQSQAFGQSQISSEQMTAQSSRCKGQSSVSSGQKQTFGQSQVSCGQSQSYQSVQLAHSERQQQSQLCKMSEIQDVRHLEQLNKSQMRTVETSADNRVQIERTKKCTEEYERTQKAKTIEIQRTGGQTKYSTCQNISGSGFQRQISLDKTPKPFASVSNPRSYSLPGSSAAAPKQSKLSPLAATTPKPPGGSESASRPNVPQPYAGGAATGRQAGAIGVAPKRGRGILNLASAPGNRVPMCGHCNMHIRGPFITALGKIWCPDHFICTTPTCRRPLQDMGFVEERGQLYCEYCFEQYLAPICAKCNSKIKGDCLNAIGKHFHPECFACAYCNKLFGNSPFFLEDGLPYCEADWNELFTTKCFACGFPVEAGDRWVEALNNNYHSQCFNCTMCKKNLEGQSFYAKGGRPFCKNHAR